MSLSEQQLSELRTAASPLMKWLETNCHPHVTAIVDSERTEIVEGLGVALKNPKPTASSNSPS